MDSPKMIINQLHYKSKLEPNLKKPKLRKVL